MKALKRQLMAAIAMVLVATIALGSSTYAWFAINNSVTATGMEVKTTVSNNLFIAPAEAGTSMPLDAAYSTIMTADMSGTKAKILQPVSTVNAQNFFYSKTSNVKGNGDIIDKKATDAITAYPADPTATGALDAFNTNYATTGAVGYVDYVFALKAVNTDDTSAAKINLTQLLLSYKNGSVTDAAAKATRIAVIYQTATSTKANATLNTLSILDNGGDNWADADKAVNAAGAYATGSVANPRAEVTLPATANTTTYYKVTVRMWLEGEDKTCNNSTYQNLTEAWKLDLRFDLQTESTDKGVTTFTKGVYATTGSGDTVKTYLRTGGDASAYKYYELGSDMTELTGDAATAATAAFN